MAVYFVEAGGNDANAGTAWGAGNARLTLASALTLATSPGDVVVCDATHSNATAGAVALTGGSTAGVSIISSTAGSSGTTTITPSAGFAITNSTNVPISIDNNYYIYGLTFETAAASNAGAHITIGGGSTTTRKITLDTCKLRQGSTNTGTRIRLNNGTNRGLLTEFINCTFRFGSTSQSMSFVASVGTAARLVKCSVESGGSSITTVFVGAGSTASYTSLECIGCDWSANVSASANLLGGPAGAWNMGPVSMNGCKIPSSAVFLQNLPGGQFPIEFINCSNSGSVNYDLHVYMGPATNTTGNLLIDETVIVQTGGASDGTTSLSYKVTVDVNTSSAYTRSYATPWTVIDNTATGASKTLTVEMITDNWTTSNYDCWLEVEYYGASSPPFSSFSSGRKMPDGSAATNNTTSSATWTTTGLGTPVKQKLTATFTPQLAGSIRWRIGFACNNASQKTFYYDPKASLA